MKELAITALASPRCRRFFDGPILVHHRHNIRLLIARRSNGRPPHVLDDNVLFDLIELGNLTSIANCQPGMNPSMTLLKLGL